MIKNKIKSCPLWTRLLSVWYYRLRNFILDFHNRTVLFRAGRFIFVTYGVFTAMGFSIGTLIALQQYQKQGGSPVQFMYFTAFLLFPMVIGGARLFSILLEWRNLFSAPLATLIKPGFMLHGGILGGAIAIGMASHFFDMSAIGLLDAWALGLPIGEAITRIGCYVYGCCWGKETHSPFSVHYTNPDAKVLRVHPHLSNRQIYPAQIIGTALYGVLFVITFAVSRWVTAPGAIVATYLILHPLFRLLHERFRQDERGSAFGGLTHTIVYAGIQFAIGVGLTATIALTSSPEVTVVSVGNTTSLQLFEAVIFIGIIALGAAVVFGVHIDKVGHWIQPGHIHTSLTSTGIRRVQNSFPAPLLLTNSVTETRTHRRDQL